MADFQQAVKWMGEGKKVKRTNFINKDVYYFYKQIDHEGYNVFNDANQIVSLGSDDFEATDWIIHEELWNTKTDLNYTPNSEVGVMLRNLKKLILDDIEKEYQNNIDMGEKVIMKSYRLSNEQFKAILDKRIRI